MITAAEPDHTGDSGCYPCITCAGRNHRKLIDHAVPGQAVIEEFRLTLVGVEYELYISALLV